MLLSWKTVFHLATKRICTAPPSIVSSKKYISVSEPIQCPSLVFPITTIIVSHRPYSFGHRLQGIENQDHNSRQCGVRT